MLTDSNEAIKQFIFAPFRSVVTVILTPDFLGNSDFVVFIASGGFNLKLIRIGGYVWICRLPVHGP